jgi:hypothetical protein
MASNSAVVDRRWQGVRLLELPRREASNVDVMAIHIRAIVVQREFELEFITPRRVTTNRAGSADTGPSPQALWETLR